ncbi:sugar transferase [Pontibacter qinzhouensis]|uniref:Sugar transferase n=1 Tax=Pontibacter qinzhouensis TaxID=2603253 RepID=A0A5C8K9V3_9BACT|nr:sugar transferase [Pontibacter qinzhouensis]TXK45904.1 sugar transferase [Pontibacter qinzhouensis]
MYQKYLKRFLDVVLASLALLISLPVLVLVILCLAVSQRGQVFFRQQRPGWREKPFVLYKFKTMADKYDAQGQPLPDELRLTKAGTWVRKNSLDELPQLFNVLRGDMSLIGPRPLLMEYLPLYSPEQARRHHVKPGITGWAQVHGRNAISWEEKFRLDLWYVEHQGLKTDLLILRKTLKQVLKRADINAPGYATAPRFTGEAQIS